MSARLGMRFGAAMRQNAQPQMRFGQRRVQSTAASSTESASNQSSFSKFWNSEVGPKTIHFWAPMMKWGVVLAGAADFTRPAEQLSLSQNAALMATGAIWTRWCFVIRPKNLFLGSVNACVGLNGFIQCIRIFNYQRSLPAAERAKTELGSVEKVVGDPAKIVDVAKGKEL